MKRPGLLFRTILLATAGLAATAGLPLLAQSDQDGADRVAGGQDSPAFFRPQGQDESEGTMRVVEIEAELLAGLEAGDVGAGCRLTAALADCHWLQREVGLAAMDDSAIASTTGEDPIMQEIREFESTAARMTVNIRKKDIKACEGVGPESYERYHDVLLQTAHLGDTLAMLHYARTAGSLDDRADRFPGSDLAGHPERLGQWKIEAPVMLYWALSQGEPAAIEELLGALTSADTMLGRLIPDNMVEATAMQMLARRIGYTVTRRWIPDLSPEDRARAQARADQVHAEHFAHYVRQPLMAAAAVCRSAPRRAFLQ